MDAYDPGLFTSLSHLWLSEPDAAAMARAQALGVGTVAEPVELAVAYADLLLLNVYPYGTVYTDGWGEINTPAAQRTAALFEAHGFAPPELRAVGAPDHLGLCLGLLGQMLAASNGTPTAGAAAEFLGETAFWAPVCCLAAERDPSAHEFYRGVARVTREAMLGALCRWPAAGEALGVPNTDARLPPFAAEVGADEEVRLRDLVRFLLAPARCGMFLSRARFGRIARGLGMRLPFGSRFEVAEWLFSSAGQNSLLPGLITALRAEAVAAEGEYTRWAERWPLWRPAALYWIDRVRDMCSTLLSMESMAEHAGTG